MRIGLIGYGKMGQAIEAVAMKRGHTISFKSDSQHPFDAADLARTDVAIEFTSPHSAVANVLKCIEQGIPVVTGSTGWFQRLDEVKAQVAAHGGTLFYGSNFSLGMNITFMLNNRLAELMNRFPDYEPAVEEIHHIHKKDSPSGTALTLAEEIIHQLDAKTGWAENEPSANEILGIATHRIDEVPGTHHVSYTSSADRITLSHEAFNREGFALGAILAAEFCRGKKGVFTMKNLIQP